MFRPRSEFIFTADSALGWSLNQLLHKFAILRGLYELFAELTT